MRLADELVSLLGDKPERHISLDELRRVIKSYPRLSAAALATEAAAQSIDVLRETGVLVQSYNAREVEIWRPRMYLRPREQK
jgi:hypothetical protein